MSLFTVIRIFVLTIFFNIILPTGDVYSDILLMSQTRTFQNTDSLEMVGCRACFGKTEKDLYPNERGCDTCVTKNTNFLCGSFLSSMDRCTIRLYTIDLEGENHSLVSRKRHFCIVIV